MIDRSTAHQSLLMGNERGGLKMVCYECGKSAVAVCRWCGVGLCRVHLVSSLAERARQPTMGCVHRMPQADNNSPPASETRSPSFRTSR